MAGSTYALTCAPIASAPMLNDRASISATIPPMLICATVASDTTVASSRPTSRETRVRRSEMRGRGGACAILPYPRRARQSQRSAPWT